MATPKTTITVPTTEGDLVIYLTKYGNNVYSLRHKGNNLDCLSGIEVRRALFKLIPSFDAITGDVQVVVPLGLIENAIPLAMPFDKFVESIDI